MRNILIMLITLTLESNNTYSQDGNYKEVNPYPQLTGFSLVDQWPMYPNGQEGIYEHIKSNLQYPERAKQRKIEGRVLLSYVVQTDGSVGGISIVEGSNSLLNEEAIRVIRLMDKWKPAIQQGKPVKTTYQQVFNFAL